MLSQDFSKIISQIKGENNIMKIPFSPPDITEKEIEQVSEALRSGWITTGPNAYKRFENEITLPLHTKLTDEEVDYVIEQFSRIVKEYI